MADASHMGCHTMTVFFNLFFGAEPFGAILIAHGTQGVAKNLSWGHWEGDS